MRLVAVLALAMCAACAQAPSRPLADAAAAGDDSVVPTTIGALVERAPEGVRIVALKPAGAAARAGLRLGDVLLSYDGTALADERQFNTLVLDSRPGHIARVRALRAGRSLSLELTVEELDPMPRL